jgi:hypothetical protein
VLVFRKKRNSLGSPAPIRTGSRQSRPLLSTGRATPANPQATATMPGSWAA